MAGDEGAGPGGLVRMLFEAWNDLDRAYAEMTEEEATARPDGASSFGWTLSHLAMFPDLVVNVLLGGGEPHPTFAREREEHGFSGDCGDWAAIAEAAREARASAEAAFGGMSDADLAETVVPDDRAHVLPHRRGGDATGARRRLPRRPRGRPRGAGHRAGSLTWRSRGRWG